MRYLNPNLPIGLADSVQFVHRPDEITQMFNHMVTRNELKLIFLKGPRQDIEVMDHVRHETGIYINRNRIGSGHASFSDNQRLLSVCWVRSLGSHA
jgi:hypothetical protein